ncbi:hypothetical protein [Caldisericum sp.]|uniref:hypothetical protein n=1 Tax=Caldisericum sp. TaxID=2499687 RepID=UPI003D10A72B
MSKEFIAELHDIGKLVDKDRLSKFKLTGHTFEDFDFAANNITKPSSPSWWTQYHHKVEANKDINTWSDIPPECRPNIFLLIIADHLASSVSRALPPLGSAGESEGVLKLWNYKFYENEKSKGKNWAAFVSDDDLKGMFETFDKITSPYEFLDKYRENLLITPEDKSKPRDITSLYTHIELVGKIYRVLKRHINLENNGEIRLKLNNVEVKRIKEAEGGDRTTGNQDIEKGKWQARFVKCYLKHPHSFVRLQDINLLVKRKELIEGFVKKNSDYVMFYTSDFISLFLPLGIDLNEFFKDFLDNGFFVEYIETIADLGVLRSNLDTKIIRARENRNDNTLQVLNRRDTKVYKKIIMSEDINNNEILPPICDICQIRPAKERIKENIKEWICDRCYEIRESGASFNYSEDWLVEKVVWFKFTLNNEKLEAWLQIAFGRYIDSLSIKNSQILKDEFRSLACFTDFINDYKKMIRTFWEEINNRNLSDIKMPIYGYEELGVCQYSGKTTQNIIEVFLEVYSEYFHNCDGDSSSPISLSLSISNIKYPLREHFRFFEHPEGFINIRNQDLFQINYDKNEIEWLLKNIQLPQSKHFLYKLAGIYEKTKSDINISVEIINNKKTQPDIYDFYLKFNTSPEKILNFHRIVEVENELFKT